MVPGCHGALGDDKVCDVRPRVTQKHRGLEPHDDVLDLALAELPCGIFSFI